MIYAETLLYSAPVLEQLFDPVEFTAFTTLLTGSGLGFLMLWYYM